ncbi:hypothetical protein BKI52_03090 [marine bacterium AO1-C]|nr:hypothetical protein BKI52_03090 [marine bacterium AO1-C]
MYNFRKIFSSKFNKAYFDAHYAILKVVAQPETATLDDCTYREDHINIVKTVEKLTPAFFLLNNAQNKFQASLDSQKWLQQQIKTIGISKNAIVIGADFILQSMQSPHTVNNHSPAIPSQYFTNEEDALLWLVGSIKTPSRQKIVT